MLSCFICGTQERDQWYLYRHIWIAHVPCLECWCSHESGQDLRLWIKHVEANGGLEAHYLACQLSGEVEHG